MSAGHDVSLRELLVFYYRHRARLWLAFFVPFCLIAAASFLPVPRYEASSVLIVRLGSEYVYQPEVMNNRNAPENAIPFGRDEIFKSEVAILGSDDLHEKTIAAVGLDRLYPALAQPGFFEPVRRMLEHALATFGLTDSLTDEQRQRLLMAKAVHRFDKRLDIDLERESAVITVGFQHRDAAMAVQVLNTLLNLYMEKRKQLYLEPRVELAQKEINATRAKAAAAEQALAAFKRGHGIYSFADQRAELLQDRDEVEKKQATIENPALRQKIAFFNQQLNRLDAQERGFDRLRHDKQVAEDEYGLAVHKLNEAAAFEDLERERVGSVRIIQPPVVPPEPRDWQWLIILAGLFVSILFSIGTAAWTEFMQGGFLTPERLERKLGLPVLAVLPLRDQSRA